MFFQLQRYKKNKGVPKWYTIILFKNVNFLVNFADGKTFCKQEDALQTESHTIKGMTHRTIYLYKNYFKQFYLSQTESVRRKINYCLDVVRTMERIPVSILKSIEGTKGLYEIRVEFGGDI